MSELPDVVSRFTALKLPGTNDPGKDYRFRRQKLLSLARNIREMEPEIMDALYLDLHKSGFEAYASEIGFVLEELRYHVSHLRKWVKGKSVGTGITAFPARSKVIPEPKGKVLIMAPWNYPFQLVLAPLIGAVAAGNAVLIKPSEISFHTAAVIAKLIGKVFDPEHVAVVQGDASVAQALLKLKFDHIFFTGSPRVGQIVMEQAAKQMIPVTLELGGKSPCIVDKHIHVKLTARRIVWGKLMNAGQTCIAPDYLLVHKDIAVELVEAIKAAAQDAYGDVFVDDKEYPHIISSANVVRLQTLLEGVPVYSGGRIDVDRKLVEPTLIYPADWSMPVMQQEIFGPVLPVLTFDDEEEVIRQVNSRPKPLALYCFTKRRTFAHRMMRSIPAGGVTINDTLMHITNNQLPFGGVGNSGTGAYHGRYSFDVFSHMKGVMCRGTWLDVPIRYAPFKQKLKWVKMLMR